MTPALFRQLNEAAHSIGCEVIQSFDGYYQLIEIEPRHRPPLIASVDPFEVAVEIGKIKVTEPDRLPF